MVLINANLFLIFAYGNWPPMALKIHALALVIVLNSYIKIAVYNIQLSQSNKHMNNFHG